MEVENQLILNTDGLVTYISKAFDEVSAKNYFDKLMHQIPWQHDEVMMYGKKIITKRLMAWYGQEAYEYRYSKVSKIAMPFSPLIIEIKKGVEQITKKEFNSCLLNLYPSGDVGMAWHADNEPEMDPHHSIVSVSFGAERTFQLRHQQTQEKHSITLASGSLLEMHPPTQEYWKHQLSVTKKTTSPRVNLTFRNVVL